MLINRDYVAYMASEVVKRLVEGNQIETKAAEAVTPRVRAKMMEEITIEDRLNDVAGDILTFANQVFDRTDAEIREALAGNLCRCGTHTRILRAIRSAIAGNAR